MVAALGPNDAPHFLSPEPRLAPRRWARAMCGKLVTRRRPASSSAAVPNDGGLWTILHRGEASVLAKPAALEHVQSRASARSKRIVQPVKWFQFAADSARYSLQTSTKGTGPRIFGRRSTISSYRPTKTSLGNAIDGTMSPWPWWDASDRVRLRKRQANKIFRHVRSAESS